MLSNRKLFKIIDTASYLVFLAILVIIPLFMDKNLTNFYIIPKQYVFICLILLSVILFTTKIILSKKFAYRRSVLDMIVLGFLLLNLLSALFSVNKYDSFLGRNNYFVFSFVFLVFSTVFYFLITNIVNTKNRWHYAVDTLMYVGSFLGLLFLVKFIFSMDMLAGLFPGAINTLDKINMPFGLFMIIIFILSAGRLLKKNGEVTTSIVYFITSLVSFGCLLALGFTVLWWLLLGGLLLLMLVGMSSFKNIRLGWLSGLFIYVILVVFFIAFGTPKFLQANVPAEVSLGMAPSWTISSHTIFSSAKNFLLGSGLGTFNVDFSRFRATEFNNDPWVWSLRFSQPLTTFFAMLAESGVIVTLTFIFITLFVLGYIFNIWFKKGLNLAVKLGGDDDVEDVRLDIFLVATAWVILSVSSFVLFFGPILWWLWWFLLGMLMVGMSFINSNIVTYKEMTLEETPQHSLAFSFIMIVMTAGLVLVGVWGSRLYLAEVAYTKALTTSDYAVAEQNIIKALAHRKNSDIYHMALARIYLLEAVEIANSGNSDIQKVSSLVAQAVNEAKTATDISPKSVAIWENLAIMYENAAAIVPEARDWAIKSWQTAKELEPTNPVLFWRLGNNFSLSNNFEKAVENYQEAIKLKVDYLDAYIGLARNFEGLNKFDESINTYKSTISYGGFDNSVILFDLGRLLYNRNQGEDRNDAEKLWLGAIKIQPDFSNALYSLGLLYESRGKKTEALQYYYQVKDLNPENQDIVSKIKSLVGESIVNTPEKNTEENATTDVDVE